MANLESVALRQFFQIVRKRLRPGYARALKEDRDDRDIPLQRRADFDANEIVGIVETPRTVLIFRVEPIRPDDRQQRAALGDLLAQHAHEIGAEGNSIDIHEQDVLPEIGLQPVEYSARVTR